MVEGNKHLFDVANRVREIVPELSGNEFEFNNDVDLKSQTNLAHNYQTGTIAHKFYESNNLPNDNVFLNDLEVILKSIINMLNRKWVKVKEFIGF